jgi:prepilin signal peptidase PulO-like enzyme (type II secretory pathway)
MTEYQAIYYFLITLSFLWGAMTGSFLNMAVYRVKRRMSIIKPCRSFCDHCGKTISIIDLLPIVGFIIRKGKTSCCGQRINGIYPVVELVIGFLFAYLVPIVIISVI